MIKRSVDMMNKLPDKLYFVRVPVLATYTPAELEVLGLPTNHSLVDDSVDKEAYIELTTARINIDRMIDIYSNGFPIYILKEDDVKEIYNTLEEYLRDQKYMKQYSPNQPMIKDDRLEEIDKFLSEMFDYNKVGITKGMISTSGFDLGVNSMLPGTTRTPITTIDENRKSTGSSITAGYREDAPTITANQPIIDYEKIKRRRQFRNKPKLNSGMLDEKIQWYV